MSEASANTDWVLLDRPDEPEAGIYQLHTFE